MVEVIFDKPFKRAFKKITSNSMKLKIKKNIAKITENPEIGKPMRYERKGTRELYVSPYRIAYQFVKNELRILFLDIYHKDQQ